jgi:NADPH:quinone reductase-like Zn-dependent oxidoreductase
LRGVRPPIEAGEVRPIVHAVLPLEAAVQAHRLIERGEHVGKLVLVARRN